MSFGRTRPPSVVAAKRATTTIPIVVGVSRDLVEQGIVSSLARPGGNVTGMELRDSEIIGKRLELLKQTLPKVSRVAVLVNPKDPSHAVSRETSSRRPARCGFSFNALRRAVLKLSTRLLPLWCKAAPMRSCSRKVPCSPKTGTESLSWQ
jgi:ABC transporter substrate binding protein